MTSARVCESSEPKPSSINIVRSSTPPASAVTTSARPRARARDV